MKKTTELDSHLSLTSVFFSPKQAKNGDTNIRNVFGGQRIKIEGSLLYNSNILWQQPVVFIFTLIVQLLSSLGISCWGLIAGLCIISHTHCIMKILAG